MDFIGRTSELATLNAELERGSGFVVIYGRRRVGKTTLIKEFLKKKIDSVIEQNRNLYGECDIMYSYDIEGDTHEKDTYSG